MRYDYIGLQAALLKIEGGIIFELSLFTATNSFPEVSLTVIDGYFTEYVTSFYASSSGNRITDNTTGLFSSNFNVAEGLCATSNSNLLGIRLRTDSLSANAYNLGSF